MNENLKESFRLINNVIFSNSNYAEAFALRAFIYYKLNEYINSLNDIKIALRLKPFLSKMLVLESTIYYSLNRFIEAIDSMQLALKIEPFNKIYLKNLINYS